MSAVGSGGRGSGKKRGRAEGRGGGRPGPSGKRDRPPAGKGRKGERSKGERSKGKRIALVTLAVLLVLVIAGMAAAGIAYATYSKDLPDPTQALKNRDQTTKVFDRDGELIAELFAEQDRTDVTLDHIPLVLRQAVIATEDTRYYEHEGVDPLGIMRALWVDIRTRSTAQGGSTITQQYVVNAFVEREDTIARKIREAILAYRVEKNYTKDQILEMYLNTIYFGHGAYGVQSAAETYFGKPINQLTLPECAMLAGVIKSPGRYSPYMDPDAAEARRTTVLTQMRDQGYIDEATYQEAEATPIEVVGLEPRTNVAPYFVEYVKAALTEEYGADEVFRGGLEVHTTLDLDLQRIAEETVADALNEEGDPSAALVSLDPRTGDILAMVGGKDFEIQQFNVAVQGRRQPGSSFKPFVLTAALEQGVLPEQTFDSGPKSLPVPGGQIWKVTGAHGGGGGPMRLREATEKSVNSVFAQLILEVGAEQVVETAQRLGITQDIYPVPAIALGGLREGVSPLEMASAYGTLANGGVRADPHGISTVMRANGEVLREASVTTTQAVDPAVAYLATDMLKGVISRGTGTAARIGRPAAGKTGTTQEYRDAWFVGYTPEMATSVWVGHPEGQREMTDVHGRRVTGGSFPAEMWSAYMQRALEGVPASDFSRPEGLQELRICLDSGGILTEWCERTGIGLFLAGQSPPDCDIHTGPVKVELPNMIGFTKEDALANLNRLGLPYELTEETMETVPAGIVADQTPRGPSEITTDTVVALKVSTGPPKNEAPQAAFAYSPREPSAGDEVRFDASDSSDDGDVVSYLWEIDGTELEGERITYVFETAGSYDVTLWVTDDRGEADSRSVVVKVTQAAPTEPPPEDPPEEDEDRTRR